ncbi:hypothetical protein ACFSHT_40510 [Paraburkholderia silviterrae]|uniref:Uncharacterized protein n=1 Tax=Paraburkholderia silviterrae TaxID=2528715 RepID=A0A4R5M1D8_9BURK|nr:hypothetical protein [Paraburkholderia silviterrae]TDG19116.1 hypothetical protein EYW47_31810 [Paraburkholderia silviterrae]
MAIPNPPDDRPIEEPAHSGHEIERERDDAPAPVSSGAGLSVALSVAFYVIVLAVGIGYDHAHRLRGPQSGTPDTSSGDWLASVQAPAGRLMPFEAIGPVRVLLAQAHNCALAGQWDCVSDATDAAIALRGDTPETQPEAPTLAAQANANAMWVSSHAVLARTDYIGRNERLKVAAHAGAPYGKWHHYRHTGVWFMARRPTARRALPEVLADLYRH